MFDQNILEIINNTAKFKKLKDNPRLTREGQLQCFMRKIKEPMHIGWKKPEFNKQIKQVGIITSI